jgi:ABC-type antimicrobial peptide transport system permease subunit
VAAARLRARPGRSLLVVAGVAAAVALLGGVQGGGLAARDRALQRSLAALPSLQRSFRVSSYDLPYGKSYAQTDARARAALALVTSVPASAVTQFPTLRIDHELVNLGGLDDPRDSLRLLSGRWPATCVPGRCEVVQVGGGGAARLDEGGIHLVRVGFAAPIGDLANLLNTGTPFLFAGSAEAFEHLPAFQGISRIYLWTATLDPKSVHVWQVGKILADESAAQALLAAASDSFDLAGPDTALEGAQQDGHIASQRMVLVGGEISALLLGFALVAAVGLRRGVWNEARRLTQRGARRGQVWVAVATEVGAMTVAGVVLGLLVGAVAIVVIAGTTSLPATPLLRHSLVTPLGLAIAAGAWLVATVAIAVAVRAPEGRRARGLRPIDVAAMGAVVAVVLAVTTAQATAGLTSSRSRLTYTLLPGLVCFAGAVVAGRLLGPAMRLGERLTRNAAAALHLAFLALARAPARTVATVGFLIVSIGLALFAASYRATLEDGASDEAAFQVPLDYTLGEGSALVLPLDAGTLSRYDRVAPGVTAYPVLRRTAVVAGSGTAALAPTVLGIPAAAIAKLHWRSDFSSLSPGSISGLVGAGGPASLNGIPIPAGTGAVRLGIRVRGVPVALALVVEDARGRLRTVRLGSSGPGSRQLQAQMPVWARRLIGLSTTIEANQAHQLAHRQAGEQNTFNPVGFTALGALTTSGGRVLTDWRGFVTTPNAQLRKGAGGALLTYAFTLDQTAIARLPQPTDGRPIPVLASANVARAAPSNGLITLDFQDVRVPARIVAVASRFPDSVDLGQGFVVADESRLATAIGADAPGTSEPDELWLSGPASAAAALSRPPFDTLDLASRRAIHAQLSSEPLAQGITVTLGAAAVVALLLAAIGVWVTLVSDARDERGELFDLEAQGVSPGTLRNQLRLRSAVLLAFGIVGGVVLGLALSRLVVSVVSVSAETTTPEPPLRIDPAWEVAALALLVLCALVLGLTELTVRHATGGRTPSRGAWTLE